MKVIIVVKGCEFSLEVATKEPILQIKNKIQHFLCVPRDSQILKVYDWELIDGLDLDDYPLISEGTKIHLTIKYCTNKLNITLKLPTKKIEMEVERTDNVRSLKEKIHIMDGSPINKMALHYCGIEMVDEVCYLSEYGISDTSEIVVYMKKVIVVDPSCRKVGIVVQTSSSLMNAAKIPVEMADTSRVSEVREVLLERRMLPADEYIFVHKQRIMHDERTLRWHGVESGDYVYVFKGTVTRDG